MTNAVFMDPTTKRRLAAGCVVGIGSVLLAVPLLDLYAHVARGESFAIAALENSLPVLLCGALVAFGGWLFVADVPAGRAVAVARWCLAAGAAALALLLWSSAFHGSLLGVPGEGLLYPLGYFLILAALLGAAVGYYDDRRSTKERHLRGERNQFVAFFDHVPSPAVGVTFEESDPVVRHVNEAFEAVFGYDADAIEGQSLAEFIVPPERREESADLIARVRTGEVVEREVQRRTAGSFRTFAFKGIPVEADAHDVDAYAIYSDITDEREQRQRLQVLYRVLRHDLRNRMNVVKGNAEIILERLSDPELLEWAESLTASADELIDLSSQTREIERSLDAGDYSRRTIDAGEVVGDVLDRVVERHPGVGVERDLDDGVHVIANDLIDTAIENAVENAFEHNDGAEQSVRVSVGLVDENYAEIRIADDGPGIPDSERQLFDGANEITQLQHASGLGLWLLNWIVTQSGGEINILDNEPRGTVVAIRLPRDLRESVGAGQPAKAD